MALGRLAVLCPAYHAGLIKNYEPSSNSQAHSRASSNAQLASVAHFRYKISMNPLESYLQELRDIHSTGAGVAETSFYPVLFATC